MMTFQDALETIAKPTSGVCPVCHGTKDDPSSTPLAKVDCQNCGGQKQFQRATGRVLLRKDGTPCVHEYKGRLTHNCFWQGNCVHCGDYLAIDSGD